MSKYQSYKSELDYILNYSRNQELDVVVEKLERVAKQMLSTIQELEPIEIDPEFFEWQASKHNLHSPSLDDWEYVYKEKSDGTRVKVGRVFRDGDLELYKPKRLRNPNESSNYVEGLNWSTYWLTKNEDCMLVKFQPSNRINEIFEDPWSTCEFNALGYKTPNGTVVHYDSYLEE